MTETDANDRAVMCEAILALQAGQRPVLLDVQCLFEVAPAGMRAEIGEIAEHQEHHELSAQDAEASRLRLQALARGMMRGVRLWWNHRPLSAR